LVKNIVRLALRSIDDEYFSPMEVAWANRKKFSSDGRADMERWFYEHQLPRIIPPGESGSGLIFTHLTRGTKGFNVDAYSNKRSFNFTFFIPLPGFRADYMNVRFRDLYGADELQTTDLNSLGSVLAAHECCSRDEHGTGVGDPMNVAIVATANGLRRALLRSEWLETPAGSSETALARLHYYDGRIPDGTFHKARPDGTERKELRIWWSPIRVGETPVWLAQASYDMSGATGDRAFEEYQIDPDIDDSRMYVLQSFWYSQSLEAFGITEGVQPATIDSPRKNFLGDTYFTDGYRVVMLVPESPVAMDETIYLRWRRLGD
jgi:hypothetical protein